MLAYRSCKLSAENALVTGFHSNEDPVEAFQDMRVIISLVFLTLYKGWFKIFIITNYEIYFKVHILKAFLEQSYEILIK